MIVDAIVLTGGRSTRLGSAAKSELYFGGETLLRRTLSAVRVARRIVTVGPVRSNSLPDGVLNTRESPPFGGPVAGIAAGMTALANQSQSPSDVVLVVACDMPHLDRVIPRLLDSLVEQDDADGVVPTDADGYQQPLAAAYRTSALASAIAVHELAGSLNGMPVSVLVRGLALTPIHLPDDATADVDTWEDALRLGVSAAPTTHASQPREPHE